VGGLVDAGPGADTITIGGGKPDPRCTELFADIAVPIGNVGGNDTIKVDENAGLLTGDGGNVAIDVTTNTKTAKIEGDDPEHETVAGTNEITVSTNDGAVNGGGGETVRTVEPGSGTTAGYGKTGR
jgi:hypothetical protein